MDVPVRMCLCEMQVQEVIHGSTNRLIYYLADRTLDRPIIDRAFADLYFWFFACVKAHPINARGKNRPYLSNFLTQLDKMSAYFRKFGRHEVRKCCLRRRRKFLLNFDYIETLQFMTNKTR